MTLNASNTAFKLVMFVFIVAIIYSIKASHEENVVNTAIKDNCVETNLFTIDSRGSLRAIYDCGKWRK